MPVLAQWHDPNTKRVLWIRYIGHWTWDEVYHSLIVTQQLISEVDHTFFNISDFTESTGMPPDILNGFFQLRQHTPSDQDLTIVVTTSRLLVNLWNIYRAVVKTSPQLVNTMDSAHMLINQRAKELGICLATEAKAGSR